MIYLKQVRGSVGRSSRTPLLSDYRYDKKIELGIDSIHFLNGYINNLTKEVA